ncbi:hypothetical protein CXF72_06280 [Psychromonas sp. MB-3u-54]|uniref:acyltransferase family protein n=1 Tax=Psychromonas sp. MB-3u-54 TaxID=2058319 RepID=UPI000C34CBC4|nr:acyltransferase family protein [Psychromonas sp. MB-3u-54]PKH03413.1 hypothetical protein CXF72_06280 [Psychromonas sp. MB-3u-54]
MHEKKQKRLYILDFLRFFAALCVVFYHYIYWSVEPELVIYFSPMSQIFQYGNLGVQLFFMISGFVICWSAVGKTRIEFISSRFARLYPTYWGVC